MREIIAELRAAKRMRQRVHAVDLAAEPLSGDVGNAARRTRDAADGAHHPELIACPDASVAAPDNRGKCAAPSDRCFRPAPDGVYV